MLAEVKKSGFQMLVGWDDRTAAFAEAIIDPDLPSPGGVGKHGADAPKRFSVYRNNVIVSLMEALKSAFPSVLALLGDETFSRLARAFVARNPPTSPMMQRYGGAFPDFLAKLPALSELPFLPDVARLELAWLKSYHAADSTPLAPEDIGSLPPEQLMEQAFKAAPSTLLIPSEHSVVDLFNARFAWPTGQSDFTAPQPALVTRQGYAVQVLGLDRALEQFFGSLLAGQTLAEALGAAMEADPAFDPSSAIATLLQSEAFQTLGAPDIHTQRD
ncbi:MAG: DNA-binding domain-containing protein [Pseudomonadota bacterium]